MMRPPLPPWAKKWAPCPPRLQSLCSVPICDNLFIRISRSTYLDMIALSIGNISYFYEASSFTKKSEKNQMNAAANIFSKYKTMNYNVTMLLNLSNYSECKLNLPASRVYPERLPLNRLTGNLKTRSQKAISKLIRKRCRIKGK